MTYDMSLVNGNGLIGLLQAANTYTGGLYGLFILVIIGGAVYFGLRGGVKGEPSREALSAALFVTTITSVLMTLIGMLDTKYLGASVLLLIGAVVLLFNRE